MIQRLFISLPTFIVCLFGFSALSCTAQVLKNSRHKQTASTKQVDVGSPNQVGIQVRVANPTMLLGKNETNYVRIVLDGFEPLSSKDSEIPPSPPVNVAIVIDTSGSMQGRKIAQARQAATAAIDRLRPSDIVSVVLYDSNVRVLVPATRAVDGEEIKFKIRSIRAGGSTALFAGVSKGAAEVRKFLDPKSINRVILLSDGQANIGPSGPREIERLGTSLVKEGISVTTLGLGLGYNEDLMAGLASAASGNHLFVEAAQDLVTVFNQEFSELMNVVAGDFKIEVKTADGVRPVRVLGTKADISGNSVIIPLTQLYASQERYFVLEVEVDSEKDSTKRPLVSVDIEYENLITGSMDRFRKDVSVHLTTEIAKVEKDRDLETYAYCSVQIANEQNRRAVALRDVGEIDKAEALLTGNAAMLEDIAAQCTAANVTDVLPELRINITNNYVGAKTVKERDWKRNRKGFRAKQNEVSNQQTGSGLYELFNSTKGSR